MPSVPRAQLNLWSLYAFIGFTLSLIVHFGTYTTRSPSPGAPLFFALHAGIFPLFFVFLLRARVWQEPREGRFDWRRRSVRWGALRPWLPGWVRPAVTVLFVYVLINFFSVSLFSSTSRRISASRTRMSGTVDERHMARAFSGHWLFFYGIPMLFFAYVPRDARPEE